MDDRTLQYADITLEPACLRGMLGASTGDTGIQYDYFDSIALRDGNGPPKAYRIRNQMAAIGYIVLYHIDAANQTAYIYGKISERQYYGDFVKAFMAMTGHAFTGVGLKKFGLAYRRDNYLFDDLCRHLHFIREGLLRGQLEYEGKPVDVNVYGMLEAEYRRLAAGPYRRMFAWDYGFDPETEDIVQLDLAGHFNRRLPGAWLEIQHGQMRCPSVLAEGAHLSLIHI